MQANRLDEARVLCGRVCDRDRRDVAAWMLMAELSFRTGRVEESLTVVDRVLTLNPRLPEALTNRVRLLLALGRYEDAVTAADRVLERDPRHVQTWVNKATALFRLKRLVQAVDACEQALRLRPQQVDALRVECVALLELKRFEAVLDVTDRLLKFLPGDLGALGNRMPALAGLGRYDEALQVADEALLRHPDHVGLLINKGLVLVEIMRFQEADDLLTRARSVDQRQFDAVLFTRGALPESGSEQVGPSIDAMAVFASTRLREFRQGSWSGWEEFQGWLAEELERRLAAGKEAPVGPFQALSLPVSAETHGRIARARGERHAREMASLRQGCGFSYGVGEGRLRVGYVSSDFRDHNHCQLIYNLFEKHDRGQFETFAYALHPGDRSRYQRKVQQDCEHYVEVTELSNAEAARRIHGDGIHILVNLNGYTRFSRTEIFALRPAPLQVHYPVGYPGSMGAEFIDYVIADPVVMPQEIAASFVEKPVYLPEGYQGNDYAQEIAETEVSRGQQGLPEDGFVFCCFTNNNKMEPVMFGVWMRILQQVPGSVLWLFPESPEVVENLRREAEGHGVAAERLVFAERVDKARHLERHRLADLFLDTRLYTAHTTAVDALWAGLPILSCAGGTFASRVTASLLTSVGLPELIVGSLEDYERRAVELARHPEELKGVRAKLGENRSRMPLFDTERFVRHLEQAYRTMWQRYADGQPPHTFNVPRIP